MTKEEIINEAGQQIQTILDDLYANKNISKTDYKDFLCNLIEVIEDETGF